MSSAFLARNDITSCLKRDCWGWTSKDINWIGTWELWNQLSFSLPTTQSKVGKKLLFFRSIHTPTQLLCRIYLICYSNLKITFQHCWWIRFHSRWNFSEAFSKLLVTISQNKYKALKIRKPSVEKLIEIIQHKFRQVFIISSSEILFKKTVFIWCYIWCCHNNFNLLQSRKYFNNHF